MKKYANHFIFSFSILILLILNSCSNGAKKEVKNKFHDPLFVELYDAADQKDVAKIKTFLQHQRTDLRTDAAWLCAYQSDTTLIAPLFSLLKDSVEEVGAAAAHALGYFQLNEQQQANIEVGISLEVSQKQSKHSLLLKEMMITAAKNYQPKEEKIKTVYFGGFYDEVEMTTPFEQTMFNVPTDDDNTQLGFATMLLQLHGKKIYYMSLANRLRNIIYRGNEQTRNVAAQAIARGPQQWLDENKEYMFNWVSQENNTELKTFLIQGISRIDDKKTDELLLGFASSPSSQPHNAIAALQGIAKRQKATTKQLLPILGHRDPKVVITALEAIEKIGYKNDWEAIKAACQKKPAIVQAELARLAILGGMDSNGEACWNAMKSNTSDYEKAFFIKASATATTTADRVMSELKASTSPIIRYACMEALVTMKPSTKELIDAALATNDIGVLDLLGIYLSENKLEKTLAQTTSPLLSDALKRLKLPAEIETYNHLVDAINALGIEQKEHAKADLSHRIDWELVKSIAPDQKVTFETNVGSFTMQLNVEKAPGSVANMVKLINDGFYNGKFIHRVVPNFVVQTGCPIGTGMGSTDYTIRSEFSDLTYIRGTVGLASSGQDTESCQWFITYLPTPRLDGRYTIIGQVTTGIDFAEDLKIGDQIISAKLVD